ncbi:hypothetical protein E4631_07135 [Hymenobacter sp. UV11]|uniref:hypothetical protein n=1 Tax=Hymenobacter sp. UV11 TaxID=1849735 RepID=UPI001060E9C3|nr:hypothetical protein [Hymenobacter sp. UV11]TDN37144.1 hypothetical protein A8B98_05300 [Hymenobacter sp. UV11]TFZ67737.1 hypothetical protein E4631_07135 [Hymenobacter sp. UV11]
MKTRNFLGAALLGLAYSFSANAQVAVPGAAPMSTTPGGMATPTGTGAVVPGQPGVTGSVLPSGGVAPAGAAVPLGTMPGTSNTTTGGTLYGSPLPTNTPAGTMSTTPGATGSSTQRTTGRRTSTTKARP